MLRFDNKLEPIHSTDMMKTIIKIFPKLFFQNALFVANFFPIGQDIFS